MNQQFFLRHHNQENSQRRTSHPVFKIRSVSEAQKQTIPPAEQSSATMFQRAAPNQFKEAENVTSLHAKLHQEADKIRKWKVQTEMDLKEKEKKLQAASTQIETMKRSLLELQLDNERLSSRMQEEIDNRQEVVQKITSTRDMCSLLKSTATSLEERMLHCETEKTELKYSGRENSQHVEELTKKFEDLRLSMENNEVKWFAHVEAEKRSMIEKERLLNTQCEKNAVVISALERDVKEKVEVNSQLQAAIQDRSEALDNRNKAFEHLEQEMKSLEEKLEAKEQDFKESAIRILTIQDEKHELTETLQKTQDELKSVQEAKDMIYQELSALQMKYEADSESFKGEIETLQKLLQDEQERLDTCKNELKDNVRSLENLKSSKDILTIEITELETKLGTQNFEITSLKTDLNEKKAEIKGLKESIDVLNGKLNKESHLNTNLQDAERILQSKISSIEEDKNSLQQTVVELEMKLYEKETEMKQVLIKQSEVFETLQETLKTKEKELDQERTHVKNLQMKSDELAEAITRTESELLTKKDELEKLEQDLKEQTTVTENYHKELEEVKCSIGTLTKQHEEERTRADDLNKQLEDMGNENKENGKSLTSQQKKVATLTKQNKDMDKELKSLKSELTKEKKMNTENEKSKKSLREEIEALKESHEDMTKKKAEFEKEMETLKEECLQDRNASKEAIAKAEELQKLARKEKENAKALTECQLAEMMGTLDTYKQNNEKMLAEKDAETKTLKSKLSSLEAKNASQKESLEDNNKQLSSKLEALSKEKEELSGQLAERYAENQNLKKKIEDLEKQKDMAENLATEDRSSSPILSSSFQRHQSQPLLVAPVTPQKQVMKIPKVPMTPLQRKENKMEGLFTPQKSILRTPAFVPKRRKVAFRSEDFDLPSSSDELMELEVENKAGSKPSLCLTPKSCPMTPRMSNLKALDNKMTPTRTPGRVFFNKSPACTPTQRGLSVSRANGLTSITEKPKTSDSVAKKSDGSKTPNVRKVQPGKSKFFTTSPKEKALKTKLKNKTKNDGHLSWFELDSVYGFNPED